MLCYFRAGVLQIVVLCIDLSYGEFLWRSDKFSGKESSLCENCVNRTSVFMNDKCLSARGYRRQGRCCLDASNITIGLDLGNCSLSHVPELSSLEELSWLNLDNNTQLNCSYSHFDDAFKGLKQLTTIFLPLRCHCPGGRKMWNQTLDVAGSRSCRGQKDVCTVRNVTCPDNSECAQNGPGFYQCNCKSTWTGYRCLIKKGIPLLIILCSIAGATVLTVTVLWLLMCKRRRMHVSGYTWINT